jgi:peptidyl-dipeptidase Dcp
MRRLLLLIVCACSSPQKKQPPPPEPAPDTAAVVIPDKDSKLVAYETAKAEVERLKKVADANVLLAAWPGPYGGVPPWDKVQLAEFSGAFTTGLALQQAEIDMIANNPEPPTFANTIAAYDDVGRHVDRAQTLFSVHQSSLNVPEVQAIDKEWSPKITAAYDKITFDEKLFGRIATVYAARDNGLTPEQKRLVTLIYDRFVNGGAKLDAKQKAELGRINQDLSRLFTEFGNKVLADENTWTILEKKDIAGLPADLVAAYKNAAVERKLGDNKWAVVNTRSMVDPFLTSSPRRDLRENVWNAFKLRGDNKNENNTNETIKQIVKLRADRAHLLGYATHAHWRMYNTMAKDPAKAEELMQRVWPAAVARVKEEVADMMKIAKADGVKSFAPWDYLYYAEKVRKKKYALNQDQLKPYFELNNMIAASMYMAEQLYGLTFEEITGKIPAFHPDVRVWEVKDKATGKHVGIFFGDYFARAAKRSGAWASTYRGHETFTGKTVTTVTSNNNNFVRGGPKDPILISLDDAQTLFHEFGHAIHSLVSEVNYPGLATTPRDFVEYPSQVHEMWVMTKPILDKFALHYKTKKPMPKALIDKVEASKKFNQGYATVEYLSSAIVDMALHTSTDPNIDPRAFEAATLQKIGAPQEVAMRHRLPQFNHLFTSDSYSAGYYSYLWSEVMDADTRQAYIEAGDVFDKTVAAKMKKYILAPGNSVDRAEAYRQFRGRDPDVKALLEKRGFLTK